MHWVCCCSLPIWRRSPLEKGPIIGQFLPRPWSTPGLSLPKRLNTGAGPWVLHPYQVSSKSIERFWKVENVKVYRRTGDGRCAMTIAHLSLWLRWANKNEWIIIEMTEVHVLGYSTSIYRLFLIHRPFHILEVGPVLKIKFALNLTKDNLAQWHNDQKKKKKKKNPLSPILYPKLNIGIFEASKLFTCIFIQLRHVITCFEGTFWASLFHFENFFVLLRITDEDSVPEMRI